MRHTQTKNMSDIKKSIIKVINVFENDSGSPDTNYYTIYRYFDGPNKTRQVTLGRGYVESGSLWNVFELYKANGGINADKLLSYKSQKGKETLPKNKEFIDLIVSSAKNEQAMRDAQDQAFDKYYWQRGLDYYNENGFKENLSLAVIQDSFLHSGSMLSRLTNSFPEKKPIYGGNEKNWITSYVNARYNWLSNASKLLQNTVYRPLFFKKQIANSNWNFNLPVIANGVKITE